MVWDCLPVTHWTAKGRKPRCRCNLNPPAIEIEKRARTVDDAFISEYVSRLGQNLADEITLPRGFNLR